MSYLNYQNSPGSSNPPSAVARACSRFAKSPLIILAILAYTGYAVIGAIQSAPMLEHLGDCFEILEESFFLFMTLFSAMFLFLGPVLITLGLWIMLATGGKNGAGAVCGGIRTYVILSITMLAGMLLFYMVELDAMDYLEEMLEEMWPSLCSFIFNMVASSSLCAFANAVEYTAANGKANVDGVAKAGILILLTFGLNLLIYFDVFENMSYGTLLDSLDAESEELANIAQICHMVAYGLFGVAALVYNGSMAQAGAEERRHQHQATAQPVPQYVPAAPQATVQPAPQTVQANPVSGPVVCPRCGRENAAKAKFCGGCGNKLVQ